MIGLIYLAIWTVVYSLPLYMIAKKSGHEYAWLAFVPIVDLWLMCDLADVNPLILLCWLFPPLGFIATIYVWWRIAESTNKSPLWGLLMVVPGINLLVSYYLAFYEPDNIRY